MSKPNGEFFWVNRHNPSYRAHDPEYATSGAWYARIPPEDVVLATQSFAQAAVLGKVAPYEFRIRLEDEQLHTFYVDGGPLHHVDGSVDCWAGVAMDVQRYHVQQAQDRARIAAQQLQEQVQVQALAVAQAELSKLQKMDVLGQLAGNVAHDFNNLLFVIRLNLNALQRRSQDAHVLALAELIHQDVRRAGRTASELMTFSGRQPQQPHTYSTAPLLGGLQLLLAQAVGAEVLLQLDVPEDLWPVHVDKTYFENSIINLAINARDAVYGCSQGAVTVRAFNHVGSHAETPHEAAPQHWVCVQVQDNGTGMTPEVQACVCEPFFTTKAPGQGTGLGLNMVAQFVQRAGGFLQVNTQWGVGSTISLYLPQALDEALEEVDEIQCGVGGQVHILLIEDDVPLRNALARSFMESGYTVSSTFSPEMALHYFEAGLAPDLIVSDVRMPGSVSALQLIERLEVQGRLPAVLFMTGYAPQVVFAEGLVQGRFPVVHKPVSHNEFLRAVREAIQGGPSAAPQPPSLAPQGARAG